MEMAANKWKTWKLTCMEKMGREGLREKEV
jgi:hypothetical protein